MNYLNFDEQDIIAGMIQFHRYRHTVTTAGYAL